MVARTELEPAAITASATRDDVPWQPTPHGRLRRATFARCVVFVALAATLIHRLFVGELARPSPAFAAVLCAGFLQAIAFRFGARRDRDPATAGRVLAATFVLDVALLFALALASGGIGSSFVAALVLPVAASAYLASRRASAVVLLAALGVILALAAADFAPIREDRRVLATFSSGLVLAGWLGAAWTRSRAEFLERRALAAERERSGGEADDWEELGRVVPGDGDFRPMSAGDATDHSLAAIAAQLSHELRDPAAMIRARAESLRYELRDRSRRDDLLPEIERLLRSADRLEDVRLTLATLGGAHASATAVSDPRALLDEVRDAFAAEFERDGVRLRFEAPRVLPAVGLTHNELRLVLVRWLDAGRRAAIAHGRNARIVARFSVSDGGVVLEVEDALPIGFAPGCDLPPDHEVERRPGLGLALAVARLLLVPRGGACQTELRRGGGLVLRARLPRVETSRTHASDR